LEDKDTLADEGGIDPRDLEANGVNLDTRNLANVPYTKKHFGCSCVLATHPVLPL